MTRSRPQHGELDLPGSPLEVKQRIDARLLRIGSVWFPSPRELRAWEDSGVPLYLVRTRDLTVEIGPRLYNMWASCFSPVVRGTLAPHGDGTRLQWTLAWPRITAALLFGWGVVLVVWAAVLFSQISSGAAQPIWLLWWAILSAGRLSGPALGGYYGGQALHAAMGWLGEVASAQVVDEEDW